jgi:hypothetical protein
MKYQATIEIGAMLNAPEKLVNIKKGQWVTVDGNKGRWVGVRPSGVIHIIWPMTVGRKNVNRILALV